ncbi:MAG TPA: oxidoreductase [Solirubrobacteraceae bacterium]|nr:oxidoreductase [Solirubrobacteraceae bacterium]
MTKNTSPRVWFITGTSSGLGRAIAQAALDHGDRVVATARSTDRIADLERDFADRAVALPLDVTDPDQARAAIDAAVGAFGRVDVVVNNAGYGVLGALEELSDDELRSQFETNLFGALQVTRAVLPQLRRQRSGHIVQLSSLSATVANPGESAYVGSKAALEGVSESLAKEVAHLGIRVTIVQPGPFRTDFAGRSLQKADPIDDYADTVGAARELIGQLDGNQPNDPTRGAEAIIRAIESTDPPLHLALGEDAIHAIRANLDDQRAELGAWAEVGGRRGSPSKFALHTPW